MTAEDNSAKWHLEYPEIGTDLSMVSEPGSERRAQNFKDLRVWQQGQELVKIIYQLTRKFPKEETYGLTSQLRRAAVSVPSNIAEGWGRNRTGYFSLGLCYSRGSIHEVESQLLNAIDLEYLTDAETSNVMDLIMRCSSGLLNFMSKLEIKR
ncbi:MAG TPA: four helix bundle protein [Flavobacteriales bacterium]|nr:four helix bundle protein [Flavobacteriales bacterium]